ncbi:hypothetical protein ACSXEK_16500 (plasmid) [Clostridium perfringens]
MGENEKLIIDWSKFKSNTNGKKLEGAKDSYVEFCKMLNETDFELVSDYIGVVNKVNLVYKFNDDIILNVRPSDFKNKTYKAIRIFKNDLIKNSDEFIKFVGLTDKNTLIAKIKTYDGGTVTINTNNYGIFINSRKDFYNKLKEIGGYTTDSYMGNESKMNIFIEDVKLNPIHPSNFKNKTYKSIDNFKSNLIKNGDKFIKFVGLTNGGSLIAKIKTLDGGIIDIDIAAYSKFNKSRKDFYNKLREVEGEITEFYQGKNTKINIFINGMKINLIEQNKFKRTYKVIIDFKNNLNKNSDKFIKFVGITKKGNLIAQIKTFDGDKKEIDIAKYDRFVKARQLTYNYCKEKGYQILSPYIGAMDKILIDFNCGHKPNWIIPSSLKRNHGCPICDESKGEKYVRIYLENNNIDFIQEYRFEDCRYKYTLPFDFYIPDNNLIIEFDGEQHFEVNGYFGGEKEFKDIKIRDKIKNNYCEDNGINLLRIPYWELDSVEDILDEEFERLRKK